MPQLFGLQWNDLVVKSHFVGFRRCFLLRWVPYFTGSYPQIWLSITSGSNRIRTITIHHHKPDRSVGQPEFELRDLNTPKFEQKIKLKQIVDTGSHEYHLGIDLHNKNPYEYKLMVTGKVPFWPEVVAAFVLAALGSGITLLIQWIISSFNKPVN